MPDLQIKRSLRILALVTDAHGSIGGIAQYNRDVLEALSGFETVNEIIVLPRIAPEYPDGVPFKVKYNRRGLGGQLWYVIAAMRLVWSITRIDLVYCAHLNLIPVGWVLSRLFRVPLVLAIYGVEAWKRHTSLFVRWAAARTDLVLSISQVTLGRFRGWCERIKPGFDALVPNAIRLEDYGLGQKRDDLASYWNLTGKRVVMTFGRLSATERYKGIDEIIDIMPTLLNDMTDIKYLIIGDGDDRKRLEIKANERGVADAIVFVGRIPQNQKRDYYHLADAYVMPSYGEGFGFVILEALACGIPVVASKKDGTREAVRNGQLGLLVDPHQPDEVCNAIKEALQKPRVVSEGLKYFSMHRFAERLREALSRVMSI